MSRLSETQEYFLQTLQSAHKYGHIPAMIEVGAHKAFRRSTVDSMVRRGYAKYHSDPDPWSSTLYLALTEKGLAVSLDY